MPSDKDERAAKVEAALLRSQKCHPRSEAADLRRDPDRETKKQPQKQRKWDRLLRPIIDQEEAEDLWRGDDGKDHMEDRQGNAVQEERGCAKMGWDFESWKGDMRKREGEKYRKRWVEFRNLGRGGRENGNEQRESSGVEFDSGKAA